MVYLTPEVFCITFFIPYFFHNPIILKISLLLSIILIFILGLTLVGESRQIYQTVIEDSLLTSPSCRFCKLFPANHSFPVFQVATIFWL